MAEIRPFRGLYYNQRLVKDLSAVICPPYDIITPQMQQELYQRSEYNFVRVEHNRELPQDTAEDNKYSRSAATLEQWLKSGILKVDIVPSIYLHDHYFTYHGKEYKRRGITVRVRLEEWEKGVIRPHEGTLDKPKSDRLSLLWALQANTSPILALYEDPGQRVTSLLTAGKPDKPLLSLKGAGGENHYVWAITEPGVIEQICGSLASQPLYIADGHHRYESALTYQRERYACSSSAPADETFNFVMMTIVDLADPGLLILPPHRLIRGISKSALSELKSELATFFDMAELSLDEPDVWDKLDELLAHEDNQVKLAVFGLSDRRIFVLTLRDWTATSRMMPYFHTDIYKKLDVSVVDHIILERILGISSGHAETSLAYSYDRKDAVSRVLDQEYQLTFILSPIKADVIKSIADAGDRMPRKSTYFYPKLPSGLILNRLVQS